MVEESIKGEQVQTIHLGLGEGFESGGVIGVGEIPAFQLSSLEGESPISLSKPVKSIQEII